MHSPFRLVVYPLVRGRRRRRRRPSREAVLDRQPPAPVGKCGVHDREERLPLPPPPILVRLEFGIVLRHRAGVEAGHAQRPPRRFLPRPRRLPLGPLPLGLGLGQPHCLWPRRRGDCHPVSRNCQHHCQRRGYGVCVHNCVKASSFVADLYTQEHAHRAKSANKKAS